MEPVVRSTDKHGPERITLGQRIQGVSVTVHCYRLGPILIDAGPPNLVPALLDHLDQAALEAVALTHHHTDHVGAAGALHERGVPVYADERGLQQLWRPPEVAEETRELWGAPDPVDADCLEEVLDASGVHLEVVPTRGHSEDHVAFHEPEEGWIFTGDAYIGPRVALGPEEDLDELLASYRRLCDLEPTRMFPGHGAVVNDPVKTLASTVEHFQELRQRAWALRDQGLDRAAISDELFQARTGRYLEGRFTHENLTAELLKKRPA